MRQVFLPLTLLIASSAFAQIQPGPGETPAPAAAPQSPGPQQQTRPAAAVPPPAGGARRVTLDEAIQLALMNNPQLKATRTQVDQNVAQEVTANLRPNPELSGDSQFLPIFNPSQFTTNTLDTLSQFDLGLGYLFERGRKRQNRLQAARDATAVTRSQVLDAERTLTFNVGQQFVNALLAKSNLEFASQDLNGFQQTVTISEERYRAGDISEGDLLKIKLQLLQFQTDLAQAKVAKAEALINLRQLMGYESVPRDYDVAGDLEYVPLTGQLLDIQAKALRERPDLRAAQQGVVAAQSQVALARANGKQDLSLSANFSHVSGASSTSWFFSIPLPIFNRNQGEISRTLFAVDQSKFTATSAEETVLSDVTNAWESATSNQEIVKLYTSGYLKQAEDSRNISNYAYKSGAATLLDLLDAERSYRATSLAYRQALATYMISLEQLKEAVGTRSLP
jgi:cobalt-zinc-cadmium efflux system outer membrane protein